MYYIKECSNKFNKDPYTLGTLIFLGVSMLCDVLIAPLSIYYLCMDFTDEERKMQARSLKCYNEIFWEGSIIFFNIAICINAIRWAIILQAKARFNRLIKAWLIIFSLLQLSLSTLRLGYYCSMDDQDDDLDV